MCEQCAAKAELVAQEVLPGMSLMVARGGSEVWPKDWYGLVKVNDPLFVFEGPLVEDPSAGLSDEEADEVLAGDAYDTFLKASRRLETALRLPAMDGYELVAGCVALGYDSMEHGFVHHWLMHHLAVQVR